MRTQHDLSELTWSLRGYIPHQWRWGRSMETGVSLVGEIGPVPMAVPGSVQAALRAADLLPDWNVGLDSRACEWVEHRHWMLAAELPDAWVAGPGPHCLRAEGLDGNGWILVNGREVGTFANAYIPHEFVLDDALRPAGNHLQIVFDLPPRWQGQFGFTSQITDWKPRFNYTWDWCPRLVQLGVWEPLALVVGDAPVIEDLRVRTTADTLHVHAGGGPHRLTLRDGSRVLRQSEFTGELTWTDLPVALWWPNGHGDQPLYDLTVDLLDPAGAVVARAARRVGFKTVAWRPCAGAPPAADPWLCVVNDRPIFLQGVNWTPILPNFADVQPAACRDRLTTYRDLGCNILRVWGGAVLERESFYDLCDELGLLVWQEFPLSSSGIDNWPPEDPAAIDDLAEIAASYIARRHHHASLLMWCGGNELQGSPDGARTGVGKPVDNSHPLMARLAALVADLDPDHRFVPTSASGPRFMAAAEDFGKGLHWDVHGPWNNESEDYWAADDALFRSEVGAPGASPAALIRATAGDLPTMPASLDNPLWRRTYWWLQWDAFLADHDREPADLEEFVAWSQALQAEGLRRAVAACKGRFPACGGVILWMGHDCFPCTANTAILDLHGRPKPAALAVGELFRGEVD